jgi:hypothetical protein
MLLVSTVRDLLVSQGYRLSMASKLRNKDNENEYAATEHHRLEMQLMLDTLQRRE